MKVAILTISDRASAGTYLDETGPEIISVLREWRADLEIEAAIIPDELDLIQATMIELADEEKVELLLTNGGTGLSQRDVTPEATLAVVERVVPGLAELMRSEGLKSTPLAALARQVVGQRGSTLIVNLPGSVKGATESLTAILPVLSHAIEMIAS